MSAIERDGGPFHPAVSEHQCGPTTYQYEGISLRDYMATTIIVALLSDPGRSGNFAVYASDAYGFADAMLAKRAEERK